MLQQVARQVVYTILLLAICQQIAASDSEVVEAVESANTTEASQSLPEMVDPNWSPNDTVHVQPYNILQASCPPGYVLANKHCHKRVRGASSRK